jgi:hypothetical protein
MYLINIQVSVKNFDNLIKLKVAISRVRPTPNTLLRVFNTVRFRHEMRQIAQEMLQNVKNACYYQFPICQERNGVHFEYLLH